MPETKLKFNHWDWPIAEAEPCGFEYITVYLKDPSQYAHVEADLSLDMAQRLADKLNVIITVLNQWKEREKE